MMRTGLHRWRGRGSGPLRLLLLAAFLFTGPGLSGVEIVAHLAGAGNAEHEHQPHFEEAGTFAHADHCGLGLVVHDGRLAACGAIRLDDGTAGLESARGRAAESLPSDPDTHRLARAPPGAR
jgi:hypothetical protein